MSDEDSGARSAGAKRKRLSPEERFWNDIIMVVHNLQPVRPVDRELRELLPWLGKLEYDSEGRLIGSLANAIGFFTDHHACYGRIWWDAKYRRAELEPVLPWIRCWEPHWVMSPDVHFARLWLREEGLDVTYKIVRRALETVGRRAGPRPKAMRFMTRSAESAVPFDSYISRPRPRATPNERPPSASLIPPPAPGTDASFDLWLARHARNDKGNAERFVARYGHQFIWLRKVGWFWWNGKVWSAEEGENRSELAAQDNVAALSAEASALERAGPLPGEEKRDFDTRIESAWKWVVSSGNIARLRAVREVAASHLEHTEEELDADQWLLNTPGGMVDLRTGQMRAHRPEDYATKMTSVAPGGDCPEFLKFLDSSMAGDPKLIDFLQRISGYISTGLTIEHALFFLYGTGGNGKGVFTRAISGVLDDYALSTPMEMLMVSHSDRHPTEVARLSRVRLVTASETERGRQWATAKVNELTGGDRLSGRFMRKDFFEFTPQFKLLISGNYKPGLRSVDDAVRRRMNLIPFKVKFLEDEKDQTLDAKLIKERPGILAWMIKGCLEWQRIGLAQPQAVKEATADYLEQEDAVGRWLGECCREDPNGRVSSKEIFASWKAWSTEYNELTGSQKNLVQALVDRGFKRKKTDGGTRFFLGLTIVPESDLLEPVGHGDTTAGPAS